LLAAFVARPAFAQQSDDEIRQLIVQESIASYAGACPCPESHNAAGRRCGGNSAYSRPGGAKPVCYAENVTKEMIDRYRAGHQKK
jgi:hypothetical protein